MIIEQSTSRYEDRLVEWAAKNNAFQQKTPLDLKIITCFVKYRRTWSLSMKRNQIKRQMQVSCFKVCFHICTFSPSTWPPRFHVTETNRPYTGCLFMSRLNQLECVLVWRVITLHWLLIEEAVLRGWSSTCVCCQGEDSSCIISHQKQLTLHTERLHPPAKKRHRDWLCTLRH